MENLFGERSVQGRLIARSLIYDIQSSTYNWIKLQNELLDDL